jgi:hypothetical protein
VLSNIGWLIQDRQFATYSDSSDGFEAHQAIIDVAKTLLGPDVAALAVVQSTLASLKSKPENGTLITLINREQGQHKHHAFSCQSPSRVKTGNFWSR